MKKRKALTSRLEGLGVLGDLTVELVYAASSAAWVLKGDSGELNIRYHPVYGHKDTRQAAHACR